MDLKLTGERLVTAQYDVTMVEHLHRYALASQFVTGKVVLDIASGEGYGTNLLAKKAVKITGVDISDEAIEHSKKKYTADNLTFVKGSTSNIPLTDKSIDVIVSFETIEHHDKHKEMLSEFKRVLKKDGILIISSPDKLHYSDIPQYNNPFHVKELYEKEFRELIGNYFKEVQIVYQKYSASSFISSYETDDIIEFTGTYEDILLKGNFANIYNIAIASDKPLDHVKGSFFTSEAMPDYYEMLIEKYTSSTTWKIGRVILSPVLLLKKLLRSKVRYK